MEHISDAKKVNHEGSMDKPLRGGLMKTDPSALSAKNKVDDRKSYSAQHRPSHPTSASNGNSAPSVSTKTSGAQKKSALGSSSFFDRYINVFCFFFKSSKLCFKENLIHAFVTSNFFS